MQVNKLLYDTIKYDNDYLRQENKRLRAEVEELQNLLSGNLAKLPRVDFGPRVTEEEKQALNWPGDSEYADNALVNHKSEGVK